MGEKGGRTDCAAAAAAAAAHQVSAAALGYQLKFSNDTEEHMPIAVKITLPTAADGAPVMTVSDWVCASVTDQRACG